MIKHAFDVRQIGVQQFSDRFPDKRRRFDDDVPKLADWRCNLTALSETHNLYFVACRAEIFIYLPRFPSQALDEPVLVIPSQPSGANTTGHINPTNPNAINNLVISFLGTEEVVATVRDDGDVDLYLIRHIQHAIEARQATTGSSSGILADEVKPIFQQNVGISCWGLAVHSEARILAVSSNRHEITVFKFGLVDQHMPSELVVGRSFDVTYSRINGEANIPCIAFCNTGDDPEGQWLLTTDINGICRTFDLPRMTFTQSFRFGRQIESVYGGGYDRINAGWMMLFLDRRSFADEESFHAALGLHEHDELPDVRDTADIWDLSRTTKHVPNVSTSFVQHRPERTERKTRNIIASATEALAVDHETIDVTHAMDIPDPATTILESEQAFESAGASDLTTEPQVVYDLDDLEDEGTEDTTPMTAFYGGERICGNNPRFTKAVPFCKHLPCPVLHASVRNFYLLQPTSRPQDCPCRPPFIGMAAPLKQSIQVEYHDLNMYERLNMSAYLPKAGVLVLASQKGRAIVLALTKLKRSAKYPKSADELADRTNYAFRVEAVLREIRERVGG